MAPPLRAVAPGLASARSVLVAAGAALLVGLAPREAGAFSGFYVSGADAELLAEATQVVLMRDGNRTVVSIQSDYRGPPSEFAMVVPVPVALQKENVKTLPREVFDRVERLTAPRLVEFWEQDPCTKDFSQLTNLAVGTGFDNIRSRVTNGTVKIEGQFEVGEYDVVILSAQDSSGLDTWLRGNGYAIPANAEPALRPYVQAGSKFFVAKVNVAKVKFDNGRASLSPIRFHYDSDRFELPVRLGRLNSGGTQDLIIHVIAPGQRYVVANYPSVTIPTNLDVAEAARTNFPAFYAALLDRTLAKTPGAIVTEYAWASSIPCHPCTSDVSELSPSDLATLGADVLPTTSLAVAAGGAPPSVRSGNATVTGSLDPTTVTSMVRRSLERFRLCYESALRKNPTLQGKVVARFEIDRTGAVKNAKDGGSDLPDKELVDCVVKGFNGLSFPEPATKDKVTVEVPLTFTPGLVDLVLTRLHARHSKEAPGSDLVFKAAPAIAGGEEIPSKAGVLETGAVASSTNSFQARYALRHAWKGAISCKEPRRGVWGEPWPDVNAGPRWREPVVAQKLAYAPRGPLTLASFIPKGVSVLGVLGGAAAGDTTATADAAGDSVAVRPNEDGSANAASADAASADAAGADAGGADAGGVATAPARSRCGCRVVGSSSDTPSGLAALGVALAVVTRRARRARSF
jgi:hypothetical protein